MLFFSAPFPSPLILSSQFSTSLLLFHFPLLSSTIPRAPFLPFTLVLFSHLLSRHYTNPHLQFLVPFLYSCSLCRSSFLVSPHLISFTKLFPILIPNPISYFTQSALLSKLPFSLLPSILLRMSIFFPFCLSLFSLSTFLFLPISSLLS